MDRDGGRNRLLFSIIAVALILYIIYHLALSASSEVTLSYVDTLTVSDTDTLDGFIFRAEEVLYSSNDGVINYIYPDGESVRANTTVANVYVGATSDEAQKRLVEIDKEIGVLENSDLGESSGVGDGASIDESIYGILDEMKRKQLGGDSEYSMRRKGEILALLNRRNYLTDTSDYGARIAELQNEKSKIMQSLGGTVISVDCTLPGTFYSGLDGYEEEFSASRVDSISYPEFIELTSAAPNLEIIDSEGKWGVGKMVTDYVWYTACEVDEESLKYYSLGSKYKATFPYNGESELTLTLYRIINGDGGKAVLIFSCGDNPAGFNYLRRQSVKIIRNSYTGYKVPVSAVHINENGETGVYILRGNVVRFKKIKSLTESGGYFVVEEQDRINDPDYSSKLGRSDLMITEGSDLYDGKIIS